MNIYDVIVIGAGPAGLLAAGRAAESGGKVLVLEKMRQPGRKLLITGKGRCNITNNDEINNFIKHVYPNGRFLRNAFSNFFSKDIINLLNQLGVETVLERGGRYFPASNQAADVLKALLKWNEKLNVEIQCNNKVDNLIVENDIIKGVKVNSKIFKANNVIIATGGKSYPATGSNGDGYELARTVGHTIIKARPALVPLETEGEIASKLKDLTLKNIKASVWINGKKAAEEFGEMLFTDFGLSGPIMLSLSRLVVNSLIDNNMVEITIDLKPALDEQKLDNRLLRELNENGKKKITHVFRHLLPSAMVPVFIELSEIDPDKECHQVTSKERKAVRFLLKNLKFRITNYRPFSEAIITAGGISTNEISSKTMESKLVKGLYFAGEVIDVDAETGGYNLQIAYSTGWLAGSSYGK